MKTRIEILRDYILSYEEIQNNPMANLGIDHLEATDVNFGLMVMPMEGDGSIKRFIDGSSTKQLVFTFSCRMPYGKDDYMTAIENGGFFERFEDWLLNNNKNGNLPALNKGERSEKFEILQTPSLWLLDESGETAEYNMIIRLIYKKER